MELRTGIAILRTTNPCENLKAVLTNEFTAKHANDDPIAILIGAFAWLGYESDWMRVRLMVGDLAPNWLAFDWSKWKQYMEPICGWDWIQNHYHPTPEYKVVLIGEHSKYTIRSHSVPALRDAFRVYRNPYLKINLRKLSYQELADNARGFAKA